jgi:threonine-phosphate decarboxylase
MAYRNEKMPENVHGGNIYKASKYYSIGQNDFLDYSANINPLGLPERLKEILIEGIDGVVNYPDPECTELKREISEYLGVSENGIIAGNGASEVIFLLFDVLRIRKVLIPAPTFIEYAKAAQTYGAQVEYFQLKEDNDFRLDVNQLASKINGDVDAVFLCNPNNPTSALVGKEDLFELVKYASKRDIYVIIDEAFIELTPDSNNNSMVDYLKEYKNLFIVRAFTKLFAIPGLRLGYGLGDSKIISRMWERKLPWSVNSLACSMGRVFNEEKEYMDSTSKWIREEKDWLYSRLREMNIFKVYEPQTNFILVKILDERLNAAKLRHHMAQRGVLIRDASNFKFLDDKYFRVAVKDRDRNIRFLRVLNEVINSESIRA